MDQQQQQQPPCPACGGRGYATGAGSDSGYDALGACHAGPYVPADHVLGD